METNSPFAAGSDYAGLKDELQKIAGIIEQYPDQLKQRAFDLLINAYLGRGNTTVSPFEATPAAQTETNAPVETTVAPESATTSGTETTGESAQADPYASSLGSESSLATADDTAANLLRKRIRLRSMSQVRWQTQSPV